MRNRQRAFTGLILAAGGCFIPCWICANASIRAAPTGGTCDRHAGDAANAAERAMKPPVLGRKNYLFCGSDAGGRRAACMYTIIETCRMNAIDPQAYLADVLARIADHSIHRIDELLPWRWAK